MCLFFTARFRRSLSLIGSIESDYDFQLSDSGGPAPLPKVFLGVTSQTQEEIGKIAASFLPAMTTVL